MPPAAAAPRRWSAPTAARRWPANTAPPAASGTSRTCTPSAHFAGEALREHLARGFAPVAHACGTCSTKPGFLHARVLRRQTRALPAAVPPVPGHQRGVLPRGRDCRRAIRSMSTTQTMEPPRRMNEVARRPTGEQQSASRERRRQAAAMRAPEQATGGSAELEAATIRRRPRSGTDRQRRAEERRDTSSAMSSRSPIPRQAANYAKLHDVLRRDRRGCAARALGEAVVHNIPRAMFVFLPLLALVMKLHVLAPEALLRGAPAVPGPQPRLRVPGAGHRRSAQADSRCRRCIWACSNLRPGCT